MTRPRSSAVHAPAALLAAAAVLAAGCASAPSSAAPGPTTLASSAPAGAIAFVWSSPHGSAGLWTVGADGTGQRPLGGTIDIPVGLASSMPDGRVLYDGMVAGAWQVYILDPATGTTIQLTTGPTYHTDPAVSPDGTTIVVSEGTGDVDDGLHLIDLKTGDDRRLTSPGAGHLADGQPAFSPDGRTVAFQRVFDAHPGAVKASLLVVPVDGSGVLTLTSADMDAGYPRWAPDGGRILFTEHYDADLTSGTPPSVNLWLMNTDGSAQTKLTNEADGHFAMAGSWSPDGRSIVYRSWHDDDPFMALRVMGSDGSNPRVIWQSAFDNGTPETPSWR